MIRCAKTRQLGATTGLEVYSSPNAHEGKLELRKRVLAAVPTAKVFDAFCGGTVAGSMWEGAWNGAKDYVGCDVEWEPTDPRRRFVGDNRIVMRSIDIQQFNVFDFDAYGEPWWQCLILAGRRRWAKGEIGGLVVTDGSVLKTRTGETTGLQQTLLRCKMLRTGYGLAHDIHRACVTEVCKRMGVATIARWQTIRKPTRNHPTQMIYTAIVFEGNG